VQPNNNLVWAILVTVFCCLPLGIVSIVKASQVSGLWAQGQYAEAQKAADDARKWAMWGAIIGAVIIVVYFIFAVATGMFATTTSGS
jgi:predicted secreted protein